MYVRNVHGCVVRAASFWLKRTDMLWWCEKLSAVVGNCHCAYVNLIKELNLLLSFVPIFDAESWSLQDI